MTDHPVTAERSLLSDLCTVCYTDKPKYRCPRCKTRTCSLPCYKRHQQRASCNGKRDAAVFVKKSEWATPAGIDHDYNFLRGVERTIDDASQGARDRGIDVDAPSFRNVARAWLPGGALARYLTANRITIDHAPKGMSRQRTNQTRVSKSGKILWTVEWVDASGHREVQSGCPESDTLLELHALQQVLKRNAAKRQCKSRPNAPTDQRGTKRDHEAMRDGPEQQQPAQPSPPDVDRTPLHPSGDDENDTASNATLASSHPPPETPSPTPPASHFYLLKPWTTSESRVLIPITASATLTSSLSDHTVQEYPTIYVLSHTPESLPPGFELEEEYARRAKRVDLDGAKGGNADVHIRTDDDNYVSRGVEAVTRGEADRGKAVGGTTEALDAKSILAMLRRDVT